MVDDGTEGISGKEIDFQAQLERYLSEMVETGVAESQSMYPNTHSCFIDFVCDDHV